MTPLVSTLVACGMLPLKKRGPQTTRTPEEAKLIKHEQDTQARIRRKMALEEAKTLGSPSPVFVRGRPRKYTEDEALEVRKAQWKVGYVTYKERLKTGLETLQANSQSHDVQTR